MNFIIVSPFTYEEVKKLINTYAVGYYEVQINPLQAVNPVITASVSYIFNFSLVNGDILKILMKYRCSKTVSDL